MANDLQSLAHSAPSVKGRVTSRWKPGLGKALAMPPASNLVLLAVTKVVKRRKRGNRDNH